MSNGYINYKWPFSIAMFVITRGFLKLPQWDICFNRPSESQVRFPQDKFCSTDLQLDFQHSGVSSNGRSPQTPIASHNFQHQQKRSKDSHNFHPITFQHSIMIERNCMFRGHTQLRTPPSPSIFIGLYRELLWRYPWCMAGSSVGGSRLDES